MSIAKFAVALTLAAVAPIYATTIFASGAGALPGSAQDITGLFPTEITGTLSNDTQDPLASVNMFILDIGEPGIFSVTMVGLPFGLSDSALFLFDSTGRGVMMNDDQDSLGTTTSALSCLPSLVSNPCTESLPAGVGPISPGIYYLAISRAANYPLSTNGEIFSPVNTTDVVGPDPANGGLDPINNWDGGAFTAPNNDDGNYDLLINGAAPEPATWIMTGIGVLFVLRRKFKVN